MLDPIALLQSLTLPAGSTTGARIELDGTLGEIRVYDSTDTLRERISGSSASYELSSGDASEVLLADLQALVVGAGITRQLELVIEPPGFAGGVPAHTRSAIVLLSDSADETVSPKITLIADVVDVQPAATFSPDIQRNGISLPRGIHDRFIGTANDTARAAGINTDAVITPTVDVTRIYRVCVKAEITIGTSGVGYILLLNEGGTIGGSDGTILDEVQRWNLAEAGGTATIIHADSSLLYLPSSSGQKTLRLRNAGSSGGTIRLNGTATNKRQFWIEDIGAQ